LAAARGLQCPAAMVKNILIGLTLALGAGACSNDLKEAVDDWADDSCGCKDKACADKMKVKFDEIEHKYRGDIKDLSESEAENIDKPYRKGAACLEKYGVHAG
jgi:hypothetical protein